MRSDKLAAQVRSTVRACVRVSAAALLVSAALAGGFVAHAQEATTVVEGRVVNASSDGGSVGGLVVTLHEVTTEGRQELEAMTEPDGRFSFDEVLFDSESAYGVSVIYQDAFYGMDLDISKWPPDPVELTVYESSSDDGALAVSSASVLFAGASPETGTISAMEIVNLVNSGDQTYVPGPGVMDLLRFGLPSGASGLRVETSLVGATHIQVDRGFALVASVPPGSHEVMYAYEFPYSGAETAFERSVRYGAENLRVMTPEDAMDLAADSLGEARTVTIGEIRYRLIEATGLAPGTPVSVTLSGLPQPGGGPGLLDEVRFEYAAPVTLVLLMATLVGYALWRRVRPESSTAE